MSLITKCLGSKQALQLYRMLAAPSVRSYAFEAHWYPDYKPGPYPKTKEEREAAAKKYNLLPEEYEPLPDDGDGIGDYPKLPFESVDSKDAYYPWDNPELRRDYMEPVPHELMVLIPEGLSTGEERYSHLYGYLTFLCVMSALAGVYYLLTKIRIEFPIMEKQYPAPGVKHYTFELQTKKK